MKKQFLTLAAMGLAMFCATSSFAQSHDDYVYIMGTAMDPDVLHGDDKSYGAQIGFGWMLSDHWNMEAYFQHTDGRDLPENSQSMLGADLQMLFNREGGFSPYLFGGAGYLKASTDGFGGDSAPAYSAGAGFRAKWFGSERVSLRGEYRYRNYEAFNDINFDDNLYSLGFQIELGDVEPRVSDSDGDGVADNLDRCPGTPRGTVVDSTGCEVKADSDGDGVTDDMDRCPSTPAGVSVDRNGCPVDSDGDGVPDHQDNCPRTVAGAEVDENGCELDSDNDGVVDRLDRCPNTAADAQVDINGCEIQDEIRLPGVRFETNSDQLVPGAESVLNDAVATLRMNPEIKVEVAGHTDSDGAAAYNESLSARRAATVRDYLISGGISSDRLSARGYGEANPIASNATAEGKAENRRVVLRITER